MLHFIPAWYQQNQWCENEQTWRVRRMHTEFDDTVKQIQLFHRSGVYPYQVMLLSFAPNFRHFLHRQGVYHAPYWSCFDAMQGIRRRRAMVLSFHNLNWPAGIEFVYTPFVVVAMLKGQKYAQIEFGEDGNPILIDLYRKGRVYRRNIYDDRGFVSSTILYEGERQSRQDYLSEEGVWKLRHFPEDGHVEINAKCPEYLLRHGNTEETRQFSRLTYDSMEQVIQEVLASYLELTEDKDIFCVAMHERHAGVVKEALRGRKMILSFFAHRYALREHPENFDMLADANYIIVDSAENVRAIRRVRSESGLSIKNIANITPYDTRVDFGISAQLNVQKILLPVDGLAGEEFRKLIGSVGGYLPENEDARVHLFTRMADYGRPEMLLAQTRQALREAGLPEEWASEEDDKNVVAENDLELKQKPKVRFFVEQCVDELAVSKCMREQRLLVDMREIPELYLQVAAVSMGIPQIVRRRTEFVENGENGMVLKSAKGLPEALHYYLDSLANWNEAVVRAYELGREYTTDRLIEEWKEVIYFIG